MIGVDDFTGYLARIDWVLAVVAAILAIASAALLKRFLEPAVDQLVLVGREARAVVSARLERRRRQAPEMTRWTCPACRSINAHSATTCYRGCGPRPPDAATPRDATGEEWALQRGGRSGRRGA